MPTDNMAIWNAVAETDPSHTKKVSQRGGFTAIGANYQIMQATKQFGPMGIGWGWIADAPIFQDTLIFVPVTLWHGSRDNTFGPMLGCEEWRDGKGRIDSDASKKATTDAITKLLSHLGFNADVFLGRYDDQKYVDTLREKYAEKVEPPESVKLFLNGLRASFDDGTTVDYWKTNYPGVPKEWLAYVIEQKELIKAAQSNVALLAAG